MRLNPDSFKKGIKWAAPIILGYVPIALAYGLLAQQAGLSVRFTAAMSMFVYAGASQFIAVSMLMSGYAPAAVIGTAGAVNFRHVLMSASLSQSAAKWNTPMRILFGSMLTDESFALHSIHFADNDTDYAAAVTVNAAAYIAWCAFGVLGHRLGALIERPEVWGLDFALPAMFIGLLVMSCRNMSAAAAALTGGVISVALYLAGFGLWAAFIGAIAGAAAGTIVNGDVANEG